MQGGSLDGSKIYHQSVVVFANLIEPKIFLNGDSKYSIRILVSKSDLKSCNKLQQQYQVALTTGATIYKTDTFTKNENLVSPIKEGLQYYGTKYSNYYILDADFEIQTMTVSVDDGVPVTYDLASGEEIPLGIVQDLLNDSVIKWAHNAVFERICLSEWLKRTYPVFFPRYERKYLNPVCWKCTMILGMYYGLPASLSDMGKSLKLENQKLEEGTNLVKYFCKPCKPTASNGQRTRNLPSYNPEAWKLFLEYNRRDVEVTLGIKAILSKYPLPQNFWQEYALDQEINDWGILIDPDLVTNAVKFCNEYIADTTATLQKLTGVANPNSTQQMKRWLETKGISTKSLDKDALNNLDAQY